MRVHTNAFKEEINKMGRQIKGKIFYYNNFDLSSENNDLIISEDNLQLISERENIDDIHEIDEEDIFSISIIKNGNILQSLMKELDFECKIELSVGTVVKAQFGLLIENNYEYLDYGNYIIKEKKYNMDTETWSYICYDKMLYSMIDYKKLNIEYPITIGNFLKALSEKIGLEFVLQKKNGLTWTPNNFNEMIYTELFTDKNLKYRDVLDKIAQILGGNILINDENKLTIIRLTPFPNEDKFVDTFDSNFLKDTNVSFDNKIGPINCVVIKDTESNLEYSSPVYYFEDVEKKEKFQIDIIDNEFAFNGNTSQIAYGIISEILGLEYYYNDFSTTGICYLDFLDRFKVIYKNKEYHCLLLNNEITITQGIEETIFTEEPETLQSDYNKYSTSILNSKETSFIVNKQQNEIQSKVSKGNIISAINQTPEQIQIQANKISLKGKEINLTTENIEFFSEVHDKYQYTNEDIIRLNDIINNGSTPTSEEIEKYDLNHDGILTRTDLLWIQSKIFGYSPTSGTIKITGKDPQHIIKTTSNTEINNNLATNIGLENIETNAATVKILSCLQYLALVYNQVQTIYLDAGSGNVKCVSVTQTSKESEKKNFERLTNAKEILKATDIYKYNLKDEKNDEKKSIGFVIGDKFNYSKEITSKDNDGVNVYSMVSVLWQVVKEQQEEINELKEMIKNG